MKASGFMLIAVAAGASLPGWLAAAEFDLLARDSYLSPVVVASVRRGNAPPPTFAWVAATVAVENHYLSRNDSANVANAVGILTGDYYVDNWQFGGGIEHRSKLDGADPDEGITPQERYRVYGGYYFPLHRDVTRDRFGGNDFRLLGGLATDRRRDGRWVDEAFVELSIKLLPEKFMARKTFFKDVTGGYLYAWRRNPDAHFVGYALKATIRDREHGINLRYMLTLGAERKAGNSHWAEIQNGLVFWYDDARTDLRYELGVSASRDLHLKEWNDQVTFAIKRDLVTRVIRR